MDKKYKIIVSVREYEYDENGSMILDSLGNHSSKLVDEMKQTMVELDSVKLNNSDFSFTDHYLNEIFSAAMMGMARYFSDYIFKNKDK